MIALSISLRSKWSNLERQHPAPWYLDQCNSEGVEVKDNRGNTVYFDDFGSLPDEMMPSFAESFRTSSVLLAQFLVAISEEIIHPHP